MLVGRIWIGFFAVVLVGLVGHSIWLWLSERRSIVEFERALGVFAAGHAFRTRRRRIRGPMRRLTAAMQTALADRDAERIGLRRDIEQLQIVLGGMSEGVIALDPRGRLLFANGSACRLFGLGPHVVGRLIFELIRSTEFQDVIKSTLDNAQSDPFRGEITVPRRDAAGRSSSRLLAIHGAILPGETPAGVVLVFHDITDLRRLERMRQDFVANVSHELKTPLAAIKAYTETLIDSALGDEAVNIRFLHRIEEQADRLDQLILDLLRIARLESGEPVFHHRPLDVAEVLGVCVESHRDRAEAKSLTLTFDPGSLTEATRVLADEEAFRQVFDNLIDNAIKYTPAGGWVRVQGSLEADMVELVVADSGIGIPREDLPRVFERFYRVDKARSRELGGTGLGLAIVKHVVSSLGGQILVDSRLGEGSRFRVRIHRLTAS